MESTPLLVGESPRESTDKTSIFWEEMRTISEYATPVCISQLLDYSLFIVEVVSVGHLSTEALASASLGSMTASVTGYCTIQGLSTALDTLLPPAFTSAQPQTMGLWTQRMAVVQFFATIPILVLWHNAEAILILMKQDTEIARLAALYLRWLSFGLPAYGFNCIARRYFQSQGQFAVQTKINLIVAPINVLLNYLLVWGPDSTRLGFIGAPLSSSISVYLVSGLSVIYGVFFIPSTTWHPISLQMFTNIGIVLRLGLGGIGQTASEWWAWELLALAASFLSPLSLATQSIVLTSSAMTYQALFAVSNATTIRIGNLLGEKNARRASVAATAAIVVALIVSLLLSAMYLTLRNVWAHIFSNDPDVAKLVAAVLPIIGLYQVPDGIAAVTAGILRAKGQQSIGALLNISGYYIIGLPLGIWFAFKWHMDLPGLWLGMVVALVYCSTIGTLLCYQTDWDHEVSKVAERNATEEQLRNRVLQIANGEGV